MRVSFLGALAGLALLAAPVAHAQLITDFDTFNPGDDVMFRQPTFSGSTSSNINTTPDEAAVSTDQAFSGDKSLKVDFTFTDNDPARWVRLTTYNNPLLGNPTIDLTQAVAMKVFVASKDPLGFTLGVKETGKDVPIGADGGTSGGIEFVSSSTGIPPTPLADHIIAPGSWQDLVFNLPTEPVHAFAGATADGILSAPFNKGTIEHLGIRSPGTGNEVTFYIDDVRVIPAAGGAIPEPGTIALLASGVLPLLGLRRRKA